jgi:hypothetical protein
VIIRGINDNQVDAIILSRTEDKMRIVVKGSDDALLLTCFNGTWISEDLEVVEIIYEWQRCGHRASVAEFERGFVIQSCKQQRIADQ